VTTFSAFQEEVQYRLLYVDFLQESLPMWVKSSHGRSLEIMEWAAKPSELRVAPLMAGDLN
jgi:hypothetical protein